MSAARAAVALLWVCFIGFAHGADDRGVHGTLGLSVQHDNNLFRLPEGLRPVDAGVRPDASGESRGDTITSTVAMLDAAMVAGRQRLSVTLSQRDSRLSHYSEFNTSTHRLGARWQWQVGNDWSGIVALDEDESASELRDLVGTRRNVLTVRQALVQANWRPRPDRRITASTQRYQGRNDAPARATTDYDSALLSLEAAWLTGVGNEWSLRLRRGTNTYPGLVDAGRSDPGYSQIDADFGLTLRPGGRTRADLRLGHGRRRNVSRPERDYDGPVGQVAVWWDAIRELTLQAELTRNLNAADSFQRPFAISTQRLVGAQLALTTQVQLGWQWSQRRTDYQGGLVGLPPELAFNAHDRVTNSRLSLNWSPRLRWQVNAALQRGRQDATGIGRPYTNEVFELGTQYSF